MVSLENGKSEAQIIAERGAIVSKLDLDGQTIIAAPTDLLHTSSAFPDGGIPLCFPFAGRVWHQGQLHQYALPKEPQKSYLMPLHGFAHSLPWKTLATKSNEATFRLEDEARTREIFPFRFELQLSYNLSSQNTFSITARVTHKESLTSEPQKMPLALGFHPYFQLLQRDTWFLNHTAKHSFVVTPAGAAGKVSEENSPILSVSDARALSLILDAHAEQSLTLESKHTAHKIRLSWTQSLEKTVLWQSPREDVYCVEPWMALPDAVSATSGATWLEAGESFSCSFEIART